MKDKEYTKLYQALKTKYDLENEQKQHSEQRDKDLNWKEWLSSQNWFRGL